MNKKSLIILVILFNLFFLHIPLNFEHVSAFHQYSYPLTPDDVEIINALDYLKSRQNDDGNIGGLTVSAWASMALSSAKEDPNDWGNLVNYLKEKTSVLDPDLATDWERHALSIVACNENPSDFSNINFVEKIISFYDGTQIGDTEILYDDYFGILSLIAAGINIDDEIIQNTKSYIISKQDPNGGWIDADSTSAAIIALISAGVSNNSKVINDALSYLKTLQKDDGGFHSWGKTNAASTSWAVMAITATKNNPTSIEWQKNNKNPVSYLLSLQQEDGSFNWSEDQLMNPEWMTSYVITALLGKYYPVKINESGYIENNPPNIPNMPVGPGIGEVGISYTFSTFGSDPDKDRVQYRFDWGDETYSSWTSLVKSGSIGSKTKKWNRKGTYQIRAQTKDIHGSTSSWSNKKEIIIKVSEEKNLWTGKIRIEGENNTVWSEVMTVSDTNISVKNIESEDFEEHYFSYPSILGALEKASNIGGFSYLVVYKPDSDSYFFKTIKDDSDWWHCWINYESYNLDDGNYELSYKDTEIIIGYLENTDPHILKIRPYKSEIKKNQEITICVFDEKNTCIDNATIYVDSQKYLTDKNGNTSIKFKKTGSYEIYAEKNGYLRSNRKNILVKNNVKIAKPATNSLYLYNFQLIKNMKNTWVIGAIDIEFETSNVTKKVDFYINGEFMHSDMEAPFTYWLNEKSIFNKLNITAKSYKTSIKNYKIILNNLIEIIEKFINISKMGDLEKIIDDLKVFFNSFENKVLIEEEEVSKEIIVFNLFPGIHKKINEIFN